MRKRGSKELVWLRKGGVGKGGNVAEQQRDEGGGRGVAAGASFSPSTSFSPISESNAAHKKSSPPT